MGFESGSISFARYGIVGQAPKIVDEEVVQKLRDGALRPTEIGLPQETEWGWCGPRHVFDTAFDFERCSINDCLYFGLRIDTNRVPSEMKQAYQIIEEEAVAASNPSGFISKAQKRLVKDSVEGKLDEELRTGRHRRSKFIPLLWDLPAGVLYGPTSIGVRAKLLELFQRTFALELSPLTSGSVAGSEADRIGRRREYEDMVPTRFAKSPHDPDAPAEYPWTAKGDAAKDFIGSEFLLWLWHASQQRGGSITTSLGEVAVMFDRTLSLDCVFNHTGREVITATGPTALPEAIDALRTGKVPRRAGLIIDWAAGQFNCTLNGEALAVGSLKLPDVEKADSPRDVFEERINLLRDFDRVIDALFNQFLQARLHNWEPTASTLRKWITTTARPGTTTAAA